MNAETRDAIRYQPLYTLNDISRYAHVHPETFGTWIGKRGRASLLQPAGYGIAPFSFMNLIEAHVLVALRKTHNVPMQRIRNAVKWLHGKFNTEYPLAEVDLETDGRDLFVKYLGLTVSASARGQVAIPEVVSLYLQRIERDSNGPARFYPLTTWEKCPKLIVMNPSIDFGRPVIFGTRIETVIIRERFDAGEGVRLLADDYDISEDAVEEALRCEPERHAA